MEQDPLFAGPVIFVVRSGLFFESGDPTRCRLGPEPAGFGCTGGTAASTGRPPPLFSSRRFSMWRLLSRLLNCRLRSILALVYSSMMRSTAAWSVFLSFISTCEATDCFHKFEVVVEVAEGLEVLRLLVEAVEATFWTCRCGSASRFRSRFPPGSFRRSPGAS